MTIMAISRLLNFLIVILLSRMLGPHGYGVYAFVFSIITLLSIPVQAGIPTLVVRETAKAHANNDWQTIQGLLHWAVCLICVFSLVVFAIVAGVFSIGFISIDPIRKVTLLSGIMLIPLLALVMTQGSAIRGLGKVLLGQLNYNVIRPCLFILLLLATHYFALIHEIGPEQAMQLQLFSMAMAVILGALIIKYLQPQGGLNSLYQNAPAWRSSILPLSLVAGFQLLNSNFDILMLGLIRSDHEVGIYRVIVQMANLIMFGLGAINQVLHPHFAKLYSSGEKEKLQRLVTISSRIILIFAIPPVLCFIFAGPYILRLFFGEEYSAGGYALIILSVGQLINTAFGSVGALLNMTGHEKDTVRGLMISAIINILLNIILIPQYGMNGAAFATAVSYLAWNAVMRKYVRKRIDIESCGLRLGK